MKRTLFAFTALLLAVSPAWAQDEASAGASVSLDGADASATGDGFGSEGGTLELGLYWGLFFPTREHELYEPNVNRVRLGHHPLEKVTPELGLRAAYVAASVFALEVEAGLLPTQTRDTNAGVNVFTLRGHAMLMAPTKTIVPFLAVGGGLLGISSESAVLGSDVDPHVHVGVGAKAYITRDLALRLDVRDNITSGYREKDNAMHWEALLGFSLVAGREEAPKPPPPPPDSDGDGIEDALDKCKDAAGPAPDGCPPPPDTDQDGIADPTDACPTVAGPASADPTKNGCPPPPDADGDGVPDASDACPDVKGDAPNGCLADTDGDGLPDQGDRCPKEPETKNGFDDTDGCPDELPEAVKQFTGVIEGIVFAANKADIRPESFGRLDQAVKVLADYPTLRLEVSGHTDTSGKSERNMELSGQRAEAVKVYFVSKGIAADRLTSVGLGSTVPIGDNATKEGRAKNRRIEFKVLQ